MVTQGVETLGREAFLQLLATQLQYQDPLNPIDSTEFVAQLAQFSELEQMIAMNQTMGTSTQYLASLNNFSATGLIGKEVLVTGDSVWLAEGSSPTLTYRLDGEAAQVTVQILDAAGNVVRTLKTGAQAAGVQSITWDGLDKNGNSPAAGGYTYTVTATAVDGAGVGGATYAQGTVTGIQYDNGAAYLTVNGQAFPLSAVVEIQG